MPRRFFTYLILVLILLVLPLSVSQTIRDQVRSSTTPVARYFQEEGQGIRNFFSGLGQISSLRKDRATLQQEVYDLQSQLVTSDHYRRENEQLRQELGITGTVRDTPKALAHLIMYGNSPLDRTFVVDTGSSDGVQVGQAAVLQGFLVGRVIEVTKNSATIRSIFSPKSIIQVWIPDNGEKGLLIGDGNTVTLKEISQGVTIPQSSSIETSGLGGDLPHGIPLGTTGASLSKPNDLTQSFKVNLGVDSSNLETVLILLTQSS